MSDSRKTYLIDVQFELLVPHQVSGQLKVQASSEEELNKIVEKFKSNPASIDVFINNKTQFKLLSNAVDLAQMIKRFTRKDGIRNFEFKTRSEEAA